MFTDMKVEMANQRALLEREWEHATLDWENATYELEELKHLNDQFLA